MGGIIFTARDLHAHTSEIVGYKSGLGLNKDELMSHTPDHLVEIFSTPPDSMLRIRSEEMEELIAGILYKLGTIPYPDIIPANIRLFHKVKDTPSLLAAYTDIMQQYIVFMETAIDAAIKSGTKILDPTPFVEEAERLHGTIGMGMAIDLMMGLNNDQLRSPWTRMRQTEWKDTTELKELFTSESLMTMHGSFFDQRFIDYLSRNFPAIDSINWRKFEALACEFFDKEGWHVEIGPGRNDDGVDARVWPKIEDKALAPTILVQCKRQKEKVSKVVVKALYADIIEENAKSGLIVTTSSLSPGTELMRKARKYPVESVDRRMVKKWIEHMRTPQTGIFLSE